MKSEAGPMLHFPIATRRMRILLLRPVPGNERFGLGPFFRIEPLGMEYIAAALEARGHHVVLADLRFSRSVEFHLKSLRPDLVGIAAMHALETDEVLALAAHIHAVSPDLPIIVGGHTAAACPDPFLTSDVAAIVVDDGEAVLPDICDALEQHRALSTVSGLAIRAADRNVERTAGGNGTFALDNVPLPARRHVAPWRRQYACLAHRPAWLVETARGCPFRCSFCSIWQLHDRSVRERSIEAVCRDLSGSSSNGTSSFRPASRS
jgi:hopanoid C-3 methylase